MKRGRVELIKWANGQIHHITQKTFIKFYSMLHFWEEYIINLW